MASDLFKRDIVKRGVQCVVSMISTAILAVAPGVTVQTAWGEGTNSTGRDGIDMYRLYNPNSGEHFYTGNAGERDSLLLDHWQYEGIGWVAPATSSVPVYRLYNGNAGDHHYTTNIGERNNLVRKGWSYEGIGWYSDTSKQIPLYREYNPNAKAGAHNYTTNKAEDSMLVRQGWNAEGIGWYAVGKGSDPTPVTMEQDGSYASIEGIMNLNGSGSGYHTKVDISGNGAVVSFGIQYERDMSGAYPWLYDNTVFLVENVMSHPMDPGPVGKEYLYLKRAQLRTDTKVRLSWYTDNTLRFYVNDYEIGRTRTTLIRPFIFAVEGSVARNGDSINASIRDVHIKVGDSVSSDGTIGEWNANNDYFGLDGIMARYGAKRDDAGPCNTHGGHTYGAAMVFRGTANIPGLGPDGKPWTWDTSFSALEPNTGTTGHPLSAIVNIAQNRPSND